MRRLVALACCLASLAGLVALVSGPASAELCFGTEEDAYVCVRPEALPVVEPTGSSVSRCVFLGPPPCTDVNVPAPSVSPGDGTDLVTVNGDGPTVPTTVPAVPTTTPTVPPIPTVPPLVRTCTGTGQMALQTGVTYFPDIYVNVGFAFTFNCVEGGAVTGYGTFWAASCGRFTGSGHINGLGPFSVEGAGTTLVLTDSVSGVWHVDPIPDMSTIPFRNSCSNRTAQYFQMVGGVAY